MLKSFHYINGNRYPVKLCYENKMQMFLNQVDSSMDSTVELLLCVSNSQIVIIYLVLPFLKLTITKTFAFTLWCWCYSEMLVVGVEELIYFYFLLCENFIFLFFSFSYIYLYNMYVWATSSGFFSTVQPTVVSREIVK